MIKVKPLYQLCMEQTIRYYIDLDISNRCTNKEFRIVPDHLLFDFYYMMYDQCRLCLLLTEMRDPEVFARMLMVKHRRADLLRMFQALIDHCQSIVDDLVCKYCRLGDGDKKQSSQQIVENGLSFAIFLSEGAWYKCAHTVLNMVEEYIRSWEADDPWKKKLLLLDCIQRRLYVESNYAMFDHAERTLNSSNDLLKELEIEATKSGKVLPNLASVYANYTHLHTTRSEYDEAYKWGLKAIASLNSNVSRSSCIVVLRIVAKVCVQKRKYSEGNFLIQQALLLAKENYARDGHPNYADTLMVFGYFLLNYDNINESVKIYKEALNVRKSVFRKNNIHVAFSYEELAYAHYVNDYSSGGFQKAIEYADKATRILEKILPPNHLSLAYTKRVKGLILEEIALDMREPLDKEKKEQYLHDAEMLHKSALQLSLITFGENNVQTAKHYGNLGRLYQSLGEYEEAEKMQLLAISIKESILGPWDFEVGLSIGHLASLYNFHMNRFKDAEQYYLRSIQIGLNLFGDSYSGLEYDYRGLIKVYTQLQAPLLVNKYRNIMHNWKDKRQTPVPIDQFGELMPIQKVVDTFLNWNSNRNNAANTDDVDVQTSS